MEIEYKRKRTLNHRAERACGYRSNLLMMDIKYDFKANPFKEKDGKPVLYPAVVVKETITTDHIVKELSKQSWKANLPTVPCNRRKRTGVSAKASTK